MADLVRGTSLTVPRQELRGKCVLVATHSQLTAALALIELDGLASRIIVCPPDLPSRYLGSVIANAGVEAIISDLEINDQADSLGIAHIRCGSRISPAEEIFAEPQPTEWVLLTSGTTGAPKMIIHTFASLTVAIEPYADKSGDPVVWGTFYDIRRYGGLQILLRAILGCGSLVLSSAAEPVADHLTRLGANAVTHISGTPSHWRRALMSPAIHWISPRYIRLSGEIADQAILNTLQHWFPEATVCHAFASTEAGLAFEVSDGLAGFPARFVGQSGPVGLKVRNNCLCIRSNRAASRYLDAESGRLTDEAGWVDTGDVVQLTGDRYYFLGRRNGVINVGGLKVYPEEVEAVINRHPRVRMSRVEPRANPVTGALVAADVVLKDIEDPDSGPDLRSEILEICRQSLPPYKVPATITCVPMLKVAAGGKMVRPHV